jgi:hypothetical protein
MTLDASQLEGLLARVEGLRVSRDDVNVSLYAALNERYPIAEELAQLHIVPNYLGSLDAAFDLVRKRARDEAEQSRIAVAAAQSWLAAFDERPDIKAAEFPIHVITALLKSLRQQGAGHG